MLSYEDALNRILDAVSGPLPSETVALEAALGRTLAQDILADTDLPAFANSAIDGFAVRIADTADATPDNPIPLTVIETIAAGHAPMRTVGAGEAARLFTGAPVPPGADGLVMIEDTAFEGAERVRIVTPGSPLYLRLPGSDIAHGQRALAAGATVDAGAIGLLASLNRTIIPCTLRPRVAIVTTGDEVVPLGKTPLAPGQIRNSNGPALAAAIHEAGGLVCGRHHAHDSEASIRGALVVSAADCDVIVASGGVSVGEFDYVKKVLEEIGSLEFWRIAIRPGKPLVFGRIGNALFFGLPGNPVSSLVTFELFVRPVLRRLAGYTQHQRSLVSVRLAEPLPHSSGRREFARARLVWQENGYVATPTGAQGSHRLTSLTGADALLIAHEDHDDYVTGDTLPALLLT